MERRLSNRQRWPGIGGDRIPLSVPTLAGGAEQAVQASSALSRTRFHGDQTVAVLERLLAERSTAPSTCARTTPELTARALLMPRTVAEIERIRRGAGGSAEPPATDEAEEW